MFGLFRSKPSSKSQAPASSQTEERGMTRNIAIVVGSLRKASWNRKIAEAIQSPGGYQAVQLRVAEQYINQFGNLAKEGNTLVVPATLSDVSAMIAMAMNIIRPGANPESPPAVSQR